uniref:Enhancer of mRNA-decapping protein 4 n=1 Tax=Ciona intestinalis TaxID=7719 RepID=F7BD94_CIOIN
CVSLHGPHTRIHASSASELESQASASNKVKINTITKFDWEHRYYAGNLLTVTDMYIAYCIKVLSGRNGYSVRVINRNNSSDRVLLKGFTGAVCDVGFAPHTGCNILAAVDSVGNLIVWSLEQEDGHLVEKKRIHLTATPGMCEASQNHRVMWIPYIQRDEEEESSYGSKAETTESSPPKILVLVYSKAEVWDLDIAFAVADALPENGATRLDLSHAYVSVTGESDADISDCELSPIGNVLAAASTDGFVKFWQVQIEEPQPPTCLHQWKPHDGKPVSCVKFCDNKKQPENSIFWRFLLTGCERNNELKIWCTVTWNCLQVVDFFPSTPAHAVPELNLVLYLSADFLVLSDVHRKILYVMQCKTNIKDGTAQLSSIAHFQLTSPLLSIAFVDARPCKFKALVDSSHDDHNKDQEAGDSKSEGDVSNKLDGVLIKLITIQTRSVVDSLYIQVQIAVLQDVEFILSGHWIAPPFELKCASLNVYTSDSGLDSLSSNGWKIAENVVHLLRPFEQITKSMSRDVALLSEVIPTVISLQRYLSKPGQDSGVQTTKEQLLHAVKKRFRGGNASILKDKNMLISSLIDPRFKTAFLEEETRRKHSSVEGSPSTSNSSKTNTDIWSCFTEIVLEGEGAECLPQSPTQTQLTKITSELGSSLQSLDVRFISNDDSDIDENPRSLSTYNTISEDLKDIVSLSSMEENFSHCGGEVGKSIDDGDFMAGGDAALAKFVESTQEKIMTDSEHQMSPDVVEHHEIFQIDDNSLEDDEKVEIVVDDEEGAMKASPDITHSNNQPVLLTPDAFISSFKSVSGARGSLTNLMISSSSVASEKPPDVENSSIPSSSPVLPRASSSPSAAPEVNFPPRSVKSPDLISSTSTQDGEGAKAPDPSSAEVTQTPDDIIQLINNFKEEQKLMMINHQKELQSIIKKQNQLQKSSDASTKKTDNQDSAQQRIDKLDKAVRAVSENQKKLSTDFKLMQSGVTEATAGKIDRIIKSEIKRTILPGMNQTLESVKGDLTNIVSQKLTATDVILRENIPKVLRSKDIVDHIGTSTAKAIHSQVQGSLPEIFFTTLIPAFERSCQNMFQQLSTTYHRGMEETLLKLEKQMTVRVKPDNDRLQTLIKDAYTAGTELQNASKLATSDIANVMKDIPNQIEKAFTKKQEETFAEQRRVITNLIRDVITRTVDEKLSQGGAEASVLGAAAVVGTSPHLMVNRPSILDQQQQILKMLQQGNVNTAFQTALTASDLNLVMYVCETVDPSVVFGVSPCPLQQPILLSLIQQLSSDLGTKTDIKLKYLQEAVMNLDRRHQVTQEYMHSVLSALVQKLNKCLLEPLEKPSLSKDLKMLAMAAQSLMKPAIP